LVAPKRPFQISTAFHQRPRHIQEFIGDAGIQNDAPNAGDRCFNFRGNYPLNVKQGGRAVVALSLHFHLQNAVFERRHSDIPLVSPEDRAHSLVENLFD
jgi:hypothetical protein